MISASFLVSFVLICEFMLQLLQTRTYTPWIGNLTDISKTITKTILPSILSAYAVHSGRYSHSVDRRQSVISVHFRIVSRYTHDTHWFVYSRKHQIQQHEPCGARFKRLFQPNQPLMESTMQSCNYSEKHVPYQWQYKHNAVFRLVMCGLKIAQLKGAN